MTGAPPGKPWQRLVRKLGALLVGAVVVIVALVIAVVALYRSGQSNRQSAGAAAQARSVAVCLNGILYTRNKPATDDSQAIVNFLRADKNYSAVVNRVLAVRTREEFLALLPALRAASATKAVITNASLATYVRDQGLRQSKPLGKC